MEERININVSATEYDKTSKELGKVLGMMEETVHGQDEFVITDSEFAFGWHFFVASVNREMVIKLAEVMGEQFNNYKGKGLDKKFVSLLSEKMDGQDTRIKFAIKEEMESGKFGIF
ncbi:MAG: hypothetical protein QF657_03535 [Candidatus Nitrosopelagicus sp.]|jgi:hypothetical protein|nr:hypothetical protein [Candidatus Nitrosopelagicus sp.]MDP6898444.1 hypothetical protein [Candidatus Nitrosopelagicus sp.]|tara:strand:+ start:431 stop:778 length:348 start_codon:yes stop_codon:yes gene_type:complete